MGYMKEKHAEQIADQISLEDLGGMKRGGFTPLPENEPTPFDEADDDWFTPQAVEETLSPIIGQDEAKKAAAMIIYDLMEYQMPTTSLFIGETGSGKTEIWRLLSKEWKNMIQIADASQLTASGWKGEVHLSDLLNGFNARSRLWHGHILVLDEFDKIFDNKGNDIRYCDLLQDQLLKLFEHEDIGIQSTVPIDSLSIVCCGAFSSIYEKRQKKKGVIGFNSTSKDDPEEHDIKKELQSFGLKPEIIGRYDRIIEMSPASLDVYQLIAKQEHKKLEESFHKPIVISSDTLTKIAEEALEAGLGGRYIKRRLFSLCENAIYSDCFTKEIIIDDYPVAEM